MKLSITLLLIFSLPTLIYSQIKDEIVNQAQRIVNATINKDYNLIIEKTHPSLIKVIGGKEKMLKLMEEGTKDLNSQGTTIDTAIIGNPQEIFNAGSELHVLVPEAIIMSTPKGKLVGKSYLLAISADKGKTWTFLDVGEKINNDNIRYLLPNFNKELIIPPSEKPILYDK